ncbi:MAG: hypothetical protein HYY30_13955 [Chloroflexi bacterium]|nr:hypothetical protein [Chloroflexota bacterium]
MAGVAELGREVVRVRGVGRQKRVDSEGLAFAATIAILLTLLLILLLFFGTVFVAPLA